MSADALVDRTPRSQRLRSCSASGTSAPSAPVRAGRRASVSSMSASSPATSPSSGSSACTARVSRIASRVRSPRCRSGPGARGVALVEDQVEHVQHDAQPLGALAARAACSKPPPAALMLLLGPADALGHRRLGHEEGAGDLGRGQAADGAQGERELRRRRERRVAAEEEQGQRVVRARAAARRRAPARTASSAGTCAAAVSSRRRRACVAAQLVGQPARGDRDEPAARVLRARPRSGHWTAAASSASCTASSQASKCP